MNLPKFSSAFLILVILSAALLVQAQPGRNLSTDQRVLTGTEWRLVSLGPSGAEANIVAGTTVTLKFGEDGRASGSTGCNMYSGTYQVRGDTLSFSRLISTRRACLDQNANSQEQRFISGLEAANRFRLVGDRLTILSDRGRNVLNFVRDAPADPDDGPLDNRADPVAALVSYYNAINSNDYRQAYRYWESPPSSFEQFARGFADTETVLLLVEPKAPLDGAAGSVFTEIPTVVVATTRSGSERIFAGCYVMRRSNVRDTGWHIYRATVSTVTSRNRISQMLAGCRSSQ